MKRVVVTGLGALTPLGHSVDDFWNSLVSGKSGAARLKAFDPSLFRTQFACELKDYDPKKYLSHSEIKRTDPFSQYALISTEEAVRDSGLDFEKMDPFDTGVIWGSGQGGLLTFEHEVMEYVKGDYNPRFSPFLVPKMIMNIASGLISMKYGLMGINYSTVSACATSNTSIMDAMNYIRMGKAKVIITGGSEAPVTHASFGGFSAMKAMSTRNDDPEGASRPFDVERDGFVMSEGSGTLILEEYEHAKARGAKIYAEVAGAAMTSDAYHMTATHPEGKGAREGMKRAVEDANLNLEEIDYLNTHATSTPVGDLSETKAIAALFGSDAKHLHINATKSMTGHLLGAAGAAEAIISIKSMNEGLILPTINTKELDPEIPSGLNIVLKEPLEKQVNAALSNTFGFGGHNASVVFRKT